VAAGPPAALLQWASVRVCRACGTRRWPARLGARDSWHRACVLTVTDVALPPQAAQIQLDRTAQDFRQLHQERQDLIRQWDEARHTMLSRDEAIQVRWQAPALRRHLPCRCMS
jgi:hypothetical protein